MFRLDEEVISPERRGVAALLSLVLAISLVLVAAATRSPLFSDNLVPSLNDGGERIAIAARAPQVVPLRDNTESWPQLTGAAASASDTLSLLCVWRGDVAITDPCAEPSPRVRHRTTSRPREPPTAI